MGKDIIRIQMDGGKSLIYFIDRENIEVGLENSGGRVTDAYSLGGVLLPDNINYILRISQNRNN